MTDLVHAAALRRIRALSRVETWTQVQEEEAVRRVQEATRRVQEEADRQQRIQENTTKATFIPTLKDAAPAEIRVAVRGSAPEGVVRLAHVTVTTTEIDHEALIQREVEAAKEICRKADWPSDKTFTIVRAINGPTGFSTYYLSIQYW